MVQIGIAVPFLVLSGVMLDRVRTAEFGFPTAGLAAARLPAPVGSERDSGSTIRRVRDNLQQASGVRSVALAEGMPIDFDYRLFRVARKDGAEFVSAQVTRVGENFLETIGAPLRRGRTITDEDRVMAAPVAVISEPLAEQLFPGTEPIGERVTLTLDEDALVLVRPARSLNEESREQEFTIVGVSADFATSQLTTERPQILLPLPDPLRADGASHRARRAGRRTEVEGRPGECAPRVRRRGAARSGVRRHRHRTRPRPKEPERFDFGVHWRGIRRRCCADSGRARNRRRRRVHGGHANDANSAVRMALGATRRRVFGLMLSDIVKLVIPGIAGGLLLASVLIRTMEDVMGTPLTLGPTPLGVMEPLIYVLASTIAVSVALLAGLPAARRATSVQPMVAMRSE